MRGIGEINPGRQLFHANDKRFYPVWEECAKRKLIVLFHTGMMGAGAGMAKGGGDGGIAGVGAQMAVGMGMAGWMQQNAAA